MTSKSMQKRLAIQQPAKVLELAISNVSLSGLKDKADFGLDVDNLALATVDVRGAFTTAELAMILSDLCKIQGELDRLNSVLKG